MLRLIQNLIRREWPVRLLSPLIGKFNPFLPEHAADPYPGYHRLRASDPVYFSPALRGWILTRHTDVVAVLSDPRFSVDRRQSTVFRRLNAFGSLAPEFAEAITRNLLMLDPPDHTRLRRLVSRAFTPRMVERLRGRVESLVDELLDAQRSARSMDLIRDFAYPLPVTVIAEMLGVPIANRDRFKSWSDDLVTLLDPLQATNGLEPAQRAYFELRDYFRGVFADRRRHPREDLVSALVVDDEQGDALTEPELVSLAMLILGAGHETTTNLIGNAAFALLRNQGERARLQQNPSLINSAVEEFLRYDSPIQTTDRVATEDCRIDGRQVRKGQLVGLVLGAANRDPEQFPDPDRLDISRTPNRHLAFGSGTHQCAGMHLARLEGHVAISRFLARFPGYAAAGDPVRGGRARFRGFLKLPCRVEP